MASNLVKLPLILIKKDNNGTATAEPAAKDVEVYLNKLQVIATGASALVRGATVIFITSEVNHSTAMHIRLPIEEVLAMISFEIANPMVPE